MSEENQYDLFEELEQEGPLQAADPPTNADGPEAGSALLNKMFFTEAQFQEELKALASGDHALKPQIITENLGRNAILETVVKPGVDPAKHRIDMTFERPNPAKRYKFTLDNFQKAAVESIERNDSVLVAAHTSAGKTAVAEYVIAKCLRANQRVIYTSPIKALSNQKYRDLKEEFGSVGLVTGDVTLDENQTCLVMTTEILRNMLFRSNEVAKETAWIIFDEVHYMKDRERGVIWEETIILAPKSVRFCLLSATTPNASELAQWIRKIKDLDCINVVYTDYRPVPLEYYALMAGQKSMLLLKNKKGELKHENFEKLSKLVKHQDDDIGADPKAAKKRGGQGGLVQDIKKIVGVLHAKNMTPGILFAFSKKDVELIAKEISKEMSLLSADQKRALDSMFTSTISRLSEEDQKLPQITALRGILAAGIGLHHGGMLPILKELVELLFQSGLIKVLVSTETFSMGINMPAKSVVFTSVQKWDGEKFRVLSGSEFVQMAGRAGRRGLDDRGFVITMMDQNIDFKKFNLSLRNESKHDPLISQFSLSYNTILNAMTMEGFAPEEMILKSFKQFQYDQNTQKHQMLLEEWQQTVHMLQRHWFARDPRRFQALLAIIQQQKHLKKIDNAISQVLTDPKNCLNFLQIGRLIQVKGCGWVPFINFAKVDQRIIVDVVASVNFTKNPSLAKKVLCSCVTCLEAQDLTQPKEPMVTSVELKSIVAISSIVIVMPQNLIEIKPRLQVRELVAKVIWEFRHEVPLLQLVADIPIADDTIRKLVQEKQEARKGVVDHIAKLKTDYKNDFLAAPPTTPDTYPFIFQNRLKIEELLASNIDTNEVSYLRGKMQEIMAVKDWAARAGKPEKKPDQILAKELQSMRLFLRAGKKIRTVFSDSHSDYTMVLYSEFTGMKKVLQRLEFFDKEEILTPKGKVASRICGADELLLTQMMFEGHLSDLNARLSAILLSFIVNEDRASAKKPPKINDEKLMKAFESSKKTAKFLNAIYGEYNLASLTEEDLLETLNPSLFDTIQKWYDGSSFGDICKSSPQYEGNLIRSIKRLFELLKELIDAADSLGNKELRERFREGQEKLYRGIVFAASLYL